MKAYSGRRGTAPLILSLGASDTDRPEMSHGNTTWKTHNNKIPLT